MAMVVVVGDRDPAEIRISLLCEDTHEVDGETGVSDAAAMVGGRITAIGGQLMPCIEIARQLLENVMADGTEDAHRQAVDGVLLREAGRAAHDALDLVLVAVADPRHDDLLLAAALIQFHRRIVIKYQGHLRSGSLLKTGCALQLK